MAIWFCYVFDAISYNEAVRGICNRLKMTFAENNANDGWERIAICWCFLAVCCEQVYRNLVQGSQREVQVEIVAMCGVCEPLTLDH